MCLNTDALPHPLQLPHRPPLTSQLLPAGSNVPGCGGDARLVGMFLNNFCTTRFVFFLPALGCLWFQGLFRPVERRQRHINHSLLNTTAHSLKSDPARTHSLY